MVKKQLYAISLLFTFAVFLLGIALGNLMSKSRFNEMQHYLELMAYENGHTNIERALLTNKTQYCNFMKDRMKNILKVKTEIGRKLDFESLSPEEEDILFKKYSYVLESYYETIHDLKDECNFSVPEIYFFYDNSQKSKIYGKVLDKVGFDLVEHNKDLIVYPISVDRNESFYTLMEILFNNPEPPAIFVGNESVNATEPEILGRICSLYGVCI